MLRLISNSQTTPFRPMLSAGGCSFHTGAAATRRLCHVLRRAFISGSRRWSCLPLPRVMPPRHDPPLLHSEMLSQRIYSVRLCLVPLDSLRLDHACTPPRPLRNPPP